MVLGLLGIAARLGLGAAKAGSKAAVQTVPKTSGWGAYAKTGIVGGSVAAGGFGISSAVGSAQQSIEEGVGGLLAIGGIIAVILLFLFIIMRRK